MHYTSTILTLASTFRLEHLKLPCYTHQKKLSIFLVYTLIPNIFVSFFVYQIKLFHLCHPALLRGVQSQLLNKPSNPSRVQSVSECFLVQWNASEHSFNGRPHQSYHFDGTKHESNWHCYDSSHSSKCCPQIVEKVSGHPVSSRSMSPDCGESFTTPSQ